MVTNQFCLCVDQIGNTMMEQPTYIAQPVDDGESHGAGFSLTLKPVDQTIEESDAAERQLQKSK